MDGHTDGQNCCKNIQGFLKVFRNAQVFYINISGFISRDKLPNSDSTEITAGGPKNTLQD